MIKNEKCKILNIKQFLKTIFCNSKEKNIKYFNNKVEIFLDNKIVAVGKLSDNKVIIEKLNC